MHVYLAGPMSGKEQFNYPAFREAASVLRDWGYEVTNPVEIDDVNGVHGVISQSFGLIEKSGWAECLGRDIARIADSGIDGVVRNLTSGEIVEQLLRLAALLPVVRLTSYPTR
jgi:hypothetical protein